MTRIFILFVFLLLLPPGARAQSDADADCLGCHRRETPTAVHAWEASAHGDKVACVDCHGSNHQAMRAGVAPVTIAACAACHPKAAAQHRKSRHGLGLHSGWGCTRNLPAKNPAECRFCHEEGSTRPLSTVQCARFLKQTPAMREIGCNRCHRVESSCAACHGAHSTELTIVRAPGVCATCHMGPDHPQWEMWQTSKHGTLAATAPGLGPTCQDCHMPGGSHDVSAGLTATPGLTPRKDAEVQRRQMLDICSGCHARGFALRDLEHADQVRSESLALVGEGRELLEQLADARLLDPAPDRRPPHPLRGATLVSDGQMLYEETSRAERIFFKMQKYDLAQAVKGAYHQNPAYTHWYGNAELKMDLIDLRAEASRLRQLSGRTGASPADAGAAAEENLRTLQRRHAAGELDDTGYREQKERLLRGYLER
ncbi:hypothetical protein JCM30471_35820 [Desulfuromonas carbonis]